MREPALGILGALVQLLDEQTSYGGTAVPVYTGVPKGAPDNYIVLEGFRFIEDLTKDYFGGPARLDIRIVTKMRKGAVSKLPMYSISQQVLQLVKDSKTRTFDLNEGLINLHTYVEDTREIEEYGNDGIVFSQLISLRVIYQENGDYLLWEAGSNLLWAAGSRIKI